MSSQTPSDWAPENPQGQNQPQEDTPPGSDPSSPSQPSAGFPQQPGYVAQQHPPSRKTALQVGALFGLCLSVLLITLDTFLGTPNFTLDFLLCVPAFLLAGLFAAKRTGKVGTGALAGLWAGFIGSINYWAWPLIFSFSTDFATGYAALLFIVPILAGAVQGAIGSGLGALGGLLGRRLSPMARQSSSLYPPASWSTQAFQGLGYQHSSPPLRHNVYRLRLLWRVFYAGIYPLMSLIAGLFLALGYLNTFGSSVFPVLLVLAAVGYNIYYGIRMSMARLVTSAEGVIYYGVGFRIYTPWHQIASIDKVWERWIPITGLTFRTPPARVQSANQVLQGQVPVIEISWWRRPFYKQYTRLIPLTWFVGNLQNSAIGRDIRWSAPHLLGGMPTASTSRDESRRPEMQEEAYARLAEEERRREAQEGFVQPAAATIPLSAPPTGQPAREVVGIPTVQLRPRWRKVPFSLLFAVLLVIASGILTYSNMPHQISMNQAPAPATASAQAPAPVSAQVLATATASAQAPNPYGGKLVISDPMSGPGSAFAWDVGNDQSGQCNFKNGAYHVVGVLCNGKVSISTKFAFEIHVTAGHNCGDLEFHSSSSGLTYAEVIVCQDGHYALSANSDVTTVTGIAPAMHTGTNQSNTIGIVSDGTHILLFINYVRVASTPGVYTDLYAIVLNGYGPNGSLFPSGEVVYSDARLWSL